MKGTVPLYLCTIPVTLYPRSWVSGGWGMGWPLGTLGFTPAPPYPQDLMQPPCQELFDSSPISVGLVNEMPMGVNQCIGLYLSGHQMF